MKPLEQLFNKPLIDFLNEFLKESLGNLLINLEEFQKKALQKILEKIPEGICDEFFNRIPVKIRRFSEGTHKNPEKNLGKIHEGIFMREYL